MKTITIEHETDTAHRLSFHKGKCRNLHGHRYKFVITADVTDKFFDFYDFKQIVRELLDMQYDHATVLQENEANKKLIKLLLDDNQRLLIMSEEPTVENMVDEVFHMLGRHIPIRALTIYETPINYCTKSKEDCKCQK